MVGTMADGSAFTLNNEFALTGEVKATRGYAGGLVGYAENAAVSFEGTAMVSGTVSGSLATGGVFGYYKSSEAENSFDISKYASRLIHIRDGHINYDDKMPKTDDKL